MPVGHGPVGGGEPFEVRYSLDWIAGCMAARFQTEDYSTRNLIPMRFEALGWIWPVGIALAGFAFYTYGGRLFRVPDYHWHIDVLLIMVGLVAGMLMTDTLQNIRKGRVLQTRWQNVLIQFDPDGMTVLEEGRSQRILWPATVGLRSAWTSAMGARLVMIWVSPCVGIPIPGTAFGDRVGQRRAVEQIEAWRDAAIDRTVTADAAE
ncbi:MAG: hypothetical protein AAF713_13895 [Pseudomonadota bacterium]